MRDLAIVLVSPRRPANVGAAARAMKNFGWTDLRVVDGAQALPGGAGHGEARALAWNAVDVLDGARACADIASAVADLHLVAAATGRGHVSSASPRELALEAAALPAGLRAGCVFGPEDSGLTNEQIDACTVRMTIPTSGEQPSLNLAQAVVVVSYEMALARDAGLQKGSDGEAGLAARGDVDRLCASFRELALRAGYLNPQGPEHLLGEIGQLLSRARPTAREVTLLLGLVAQLRWAQERGRTP